MKVPCVKCGQRKAETVGVRTDGLTCASCSGEDVPLLVIEVKDLNSLPVVKHNGELITGMIAIEYSWGTRTEVVGDHEYMIEHVIEQDKGKVPLIRKLNEKRWV